MYKICKKKFSRNKQKILNLWQQRQETHYSDAQTDPRLHRLARVSTKPVCCMVTQTFYGIMNASYNVATFPKKKKKKV